MLRRGSSWWWLKPGTVWLVVLATIFGTEYGVMLALPWLLPAEPTRLLEAAVDAFTLTAVLAPLLWWTVVRPLKEVIRLRTRFLTELVSRTESNRRSIAHELHDGIGQSLSLLVSGLRSAQASMSDQADACRCAHLAHLAQAALRDVKRLALGLRPSILDDLGLAPAMESLVTGLREQYPVEITLDVGALDGVRLPEAVETAVFRIAQEALANVVAHAHARHASVAVRREAGALSLDVTDDGCGFETPGKSAGVPGHLGLLGMRERATLLGGRFAATSRPGHGTRVTVTIPLKG